MAREAKGGGLLLPPLKTSFNSHCFPAQLYQIEFQREPGAHFLKSPRFTRVCCTNFSQTPHLGLLGHLRHSEAQVLGWGWGLLLLQVQKRKGFLLSPGNCAIPWSRISVSCLTSSTSGGISELLFTRTASSHHPHSHLNCSIPPAPSHLNCSISPELPHFTSSIPPELPNLIIPMPPELLHPT